MTIALKHTQSFSDKDNLVCLVDEKTSWSKLPLDKNEIAFVKDQIVNGVKTMTFNHLKRFVIVVLIESDHKDSRYFEVFRKEGFNVVGTLNNNKVSEVTLLNFSILTDGALYLAEGIGLGNYKFLKYKDHKPEKNTLETVHIHSYAGKPERVKMMEDQIDGTCVARDLVNEPLSYLTAEQYSKDMKALGKKAGFNVEVLNKAKIEALKMGGLLAVNLGSPNPPTFNILTYKGPKAVNKKPMVLVGKGVVYDTGGLSLKPTPNSMDYMKCDMGGSAAVLGAIYAAAKSKLPVNLVGLIPATENRPGGNAYVPGDVITMHSGKRVEVLNTDAEGRMVLADALSYAKKYKPSLVVDFATLTGAAARAIGTQGIVYMGTADAKTKAMFEKSGQEVHERLVEFPLWDEYFEAIKSDVADIKNIGGALAGATTAGMFLKEFTDYEWLHFDIAGPAFLHTEDSYRGKNATGSGVRLLYQYFLNMSGK